jgi:hypothetical protein
MRADHCYFEKATLNKEGIMANCCDMKEGDIFYCKMCGLELSVKKACTCKEGEEDSCTVPLKCCNQEMTKK